MMTDHVLDGHLIGECADVAAHYAEADKQAIPKCLENRAEQLDLAILSGQHNSDTGPEAFYCVSAYCPRCQELRQFNGIAVVQPNAWAHDGKAEQEAERTAIAYDRQSAAELAVKLCSAFIAPDGEGPDDVREAALQSLVLLAEKIRIQREQMIEQCADDQHLIYAVHAGFELAAQLTYRSREHISSSFGAISQALGRYVAGEVDFTLSGPMHKSENGGF